MGVVWEVAGRLAADRAPFGYDAAGRGGRREEG